MLALKAIYESGKVIFLDPQLPERRSLVVVTFMDEEEERKEIPSEKTFLVYKNPRLRKLLRFKKQDKDFLQSLHRAREKAYQQFIILPRNICVVRENVTIA
ncbi:MAG: hypothetical protein QME81_20330, partial [bacterium]|nr:hypothetical protein [bacterium]